MDTHNDDIVFWNTIGCNSSGEEIEMAKGTFNGAIQVAVLPTRSLRVILILCPLTREFKTSDILGLRARVED